MPRGLAVVSAYKPARPVPIDCYHSTCAVIHALHTGAGTSAESGIPTFRGAGGLWRQYEATDLGAINSTSRLYSAHVVLVSAQAVDKISCNIRLPAATPEAFVEDPSLVWEFYHWRREV